MMLIGQARQISFPDRVRRLRRTGSVLGYAYILFKSTTVYLTRGMGDPKDRI